MVNENDIQDLFEKIRELFRNCDSDAEMAGMYTAIWNLAGSLQGLEIFQKTVKRG